MAKMQGSWICPTCHESVDYNLEVCWNCQHNKDGVIPKAFSTSAEVERRTDEAPKRICLRCETNMTYAGKREFHEGMRWGMFGDLAEFFVNQTKLEMYFCPSCRHVEFFV